MKKRFLCAVKKDIKEFIKNKKNVLYSLLVLLICAFVLASTELLTPLIGTLMGKVENIVTDVETLDEVLSSLFPKTLKANMGILASDILIFYGSIAILTSFDLVPKEVTDGKWIFPVSVGYKPFELIISKGLVYSAGAVVPVVVFYTLYYFMGSLYLKCDWLLTGAFLNAIVLAVVIFASIYITVLMAAVARRPVITATTVIMTIIAAPDIFSLFAFGKYLPTHLLTFVYQSTGKAVDLVVPGLLMIALLILITAWVYKKSINMKVKH